MITGMIKTLLQRDLQKLKEEIDAYANEDRLWYVEKNIANSAGNLCLHLVGNLNTFIGAVLGKTGYIRHRELEFSQKGVPKTELLKKIDDTITVVEQTLSSVKDDQLDADFPMKMFPENPSTAYMLIHLATHLTYHLGQVNYHRRLFDQT